jgi:hypothetical protein
MPARAALKAGDGIAAINMVQPITGINLETRCARSPAWRGYSTLLLLCRCEADRVSEVYGCCKFTRG